MAQTFKKTFIYSGEHKYHGELASSSSTNVIPNSGVTKIISASSYVLQGPYPGALVTIYAVGVDAVINSVSTTAGSTGQAAFNGAAGSGPLLVGRVTYDTLRTNQPSADKSRCAARWRSSRRGH
jgi:hypothetical protein